MDVTRDARAVSTWRLYGEPFLVLLAAFSVIVAVNLTLDTMRPADFHAFWDSARAWRSGADPYLGYPPRPGTGYNLNPPAALLLFVPFSFLPLVPAILVWNALSLVAYVLAAHWIAREIAPRDTVTIAAIVLASQATFAALHLGQITGFLMLLFTAAWIASRHGRLLAAGLLLGVAAGLKLFLGIFVVYALWERSTRMIAGLVAGALATALIGLLAAGSEGFVSWLRVLGAIAWTSHLSNGSLLGFLTRELTPPDETLLVTPLTLRPDLVALAWYVIAGVTAAAAGYALRQTRDRDKAWALTALAGILLSPLGWVYYAPVVAGPAFAVYLKGSASAQRLLIAGYVGFLLPYTLIAVPLGVVATAVIAGAYTWAYLLWLIAAILPMPSELR